MMKIIAMKTSIPILGMFACMLLLFFTASGCEETTPPPPAKPVVVKKRITEEVPPARPKKEDVPPQTKAKVTPPAQPGGPAPSSPSPPVVPSTEALAPKADAPKVAPKKPGKEKGLVAAVADLSLTEKIADVSPRYDPKGKVDPFAPLFKERPAPIVKNEQKYKRRRPLTPLEKIDLSQLKLVGVIRAKSANRAMVEDATGKGYVITKGSYVGIHGGRVVKIEKDRAFIEEQLEDIFGKITVSRKELKLQKPAGEE